MGAGRRVRLEWASQKPPEKVTIRRPYQEQGFSTEYLIELVHWPKTTTLRWISVRGGGHLTYIYQWIPGDQVGTSIARTPYGGSLREEQHRFSQEA